MSQNRIHLLLGTNLNDREKNLRTAQIYIEKEIGAIGEKSKIIETKPEGFISENDFLNQIIVVNSELSPVSTLKIIKQIESKMGRVYLPTQQNYQDRIIDIDILSFNRIIFESCILTLPHHQIFSRKFLKKIMI